MSGNVEVPAIYLTTYTHTHTHTHRHTHTCLWYHPGDHATFLEGGKMQEIFIVVQAFSLESKRNICPLVCFHPGVFLLKPSVSKTYKVNKTEKNIFGSVEGRNRFVRSIKTTCQKVFRGRGQSDLKYIPAVSLRGGNRR